MALYQEEYSHGCSSEELPEVTESNRQLVAIVTLLCVYVCMGLELLRLAIVDQSKGFIITTFCRFVSG